MVKKESRLTKCSGVSALPLLRAGKISETHFREPGQSQVNIYSFSLFVAEEGMATDSLLAVILKNEDSGSYKTFSPMNEK